MDATSSSAAYAPSSISGQGTSGLDAGQGLSSELESLFDSLLKMSQGDGSQDATGGSGGKVEKELELALHSLLDALEDGQGGASATPPAASGPGSSGPSTSNVPEAAGSAPEATGNALGGTGSADGGAAAQPAGAPGSTGTSSGADDPGASAPDASAPNASGPGNTAPGASAPGASGALSSMPTEPVQASNPSQVMNSEMSAGKTQVYDALKQQGATPQEIAMVMGSGMVETNDFNADQRDTSKDGTASENYSAFNLNEPELQKLGYTGDPSALNNQNNIGQVATLLLNGIRKDGFNEVAGMTRDSVNFDPNSSDIQQWDSERAADANKLLQLYQQEGTQAFTDNERVASYSQHI